MSEELKVDASVVEEPVVEVQIDPVEEQAREQGWVSKEEWVEAGRSADDWKPAKEFVRTGELYKSIHSLKRENRQTQAALDALQRHHKLVYEKSYQDAMKQLKAEKRAAMREGDFEYVEAVEGKIEELQDNRVKDVAQFNQVAQVAQAATPDPEFVAFTDKNPWYIMDKQLRDEADAIGFVYLNNGGSRIGLLQHVEKEVKRKFPDKFGVKRAAPNAVAGVNRTARSGKGVDIQLDEMETSIMRNLVDSGVMTEAEYKTELKRAKGLK